MAAMPRNAAALGRHAAAKREIILQIQKTQNTKYQKLKIKCVFHVSVFRKKKSDLDLSRLVSVNLTGYKWFYITAYNMVVIVINLRSTN